MTLDVGTVLHDRYRIESVMAQGGMGSIYRAVDLSLGVPVAVKENLGTTDESTRQFRREATILAGLRHPNLPRVTDHFVMPGQGQYLIMDYIDGEDLRHRMQRQERIGEDEAIRIGVSVCDALAYLHTRTNPVLHRDIKPGNLKISPSGQVYLVDFGLAKISQTGQITTIGAQALTPGYAPPEQYGQGTEPRSDLYSLGATLYAALTNRVPEDALARAMGTAALYPLRKTNPAVSEQLAQVIEKAMAVKTEERYKTAEDFKQALLGVGAATRRRPERASANVAQLAQSPTIATPKIQPASSAGVLSPASGAPEPASGTSLQAGRAATAPAKRNFLVIPLILAGFILLAVCTAGGFFYFRYNPGIYTAATFKITATVLPVQPTNLPTATLHPMPTETQVVPVILITSTPLPTLPGATLAPIVTNPPAATPIGGSSGQLAFVSNRSGKYQIWLMNSDGSDQKQLTNLPDGACQPAWSPDGIKLVIVSPCRSRQDIYKGSSLFIIKGDGSGLTPMPSVPGGDFSPAWSPDGSQIAFSSIRQNNVPYIFLADAVSGRATRLTNTSTNELRPAWSPDGKTLAFVSSRLGIFEIWTIDMTTKQVSEFSRIPDGKGDMPAWGPAGDRITFVLGTDNPQLVSRQFPPAATDIFPVADLRPTHNPSSSRDGYWLAFDSQQTGNLDIYLMNALTGANLTRLTDDPAEDYFPVWRP